MVESLEGKEIKANNNSNKNSQQFNALNYTHMFCNMWKTKSIFCFCLQQFYARSKLGGRGEEAGTKGHPGIRVLFKLLAGEKKNTFEAKSTHFEEHFWHQFFNVSNFKILLFLPECIGQHISNRCLSISQHSISVFYFFFFFFF